VDTRSKKRLLVTLLGLWALTVGYGVLDGSVDDGGVPSASGPVTISAVVIALVKVRIIFREFMEVRHAPAVLSRLTDLCLALMAVVMLGSYVVGRSVQ
jgi:Prokaryotic Cytochrome C oxidase subunit IV